MKSLSILILLVIFSSVSTNASARASDFKVKTLQGEAVPLSSFFEEGKWTMIMMWTTYCGTCRAQYPTVSEFHDKHKSTDAKVVGISLDGYAEVEKVRAYVKTKPMTFDNTIVEVADIQKAYKAITEESFSGTPTYLMFDPSGALVAHVPGTLTMEDVEEFIANYAE